MAQRRQKPLLQLELRYISRARLKTFIFSSSVLKVMVKRILVSSAQANQRVDEFEHCNI